MCFMNNAEPAQSQRIYSQGSRELITVIWGSGMFVWGKIYCSGGDRRESSFSFPECWSSLWAASWKIGRILMQVFHLETLFMCIKVQKWYLLAVFLLKQIILLNWGLWISRDRADLHEKQLYISVFNMKCKYVCWC